jgi:hypothetical protein
MPSCRRPWRVGSSHEVIGPGTPRLILVATGNIPNEALLALFHDRFEGVIDALTRSQSVVEIG